MSNEVLIEVNASNAAAKVVFADTEAAGKALGAKGVTVPVKAQLAYDQVNGLGALTKEMEKTPPVRVPVVATNPINEAFVAQVRASVRSISGDALKIPVNPDLVDFEAQLEETLTGLRGITRLDIPVDVGDAMIFRAQVEELVAQVEASTKAVIDISVNESGLSNLQAKTVASSQATLELVGAEQKLNAVIAAGDEEGLAKARQDVVAATTAERAATEELAAAQEAAKAEAMGLAESEDVAAGASRGLGAAMGPLWMVINTAQIAMFAFGSSSSSTATQVQDVSQQIIGLGEATGQTAQNLLLGNQSLQQVSGQLTAAKTSATAFAQAFSGNIDTGKQYVDGLVKQQKALDGQHTTITQSIQDNADQTSTTVQTTMTIGQLTSMVDSHRVSMEDLSGPQQAAVTQYRALGGPNGVISQARNALGAMTAAAAQQQQTLAALGFTMTAGQQSANNYGLGVQSAAKALMDATAGSKYLEDSTDQASITAGQAVASWHQLQAAVVSASQAHGQAAAAVANAGHAQEVASDGVAAAIHGEEQAADGVTQARHAEEQAIIATQRAQDNYTNAVDQERQAQVAVTAARAAAEQQLISLKLQSDSAATSVDSARDSLFLATQNASKYGVNAGNAHQIADGQISGANEKQVAAAIALEQAENQLAGAQDSSSRAQADLNTARKQGVDGNPGVLSAQRSLVQAKDGVKQAAQGVEAAEYAQQRSVKAVSDAEYAQGQASKQVANAEWGLQQASQGVATAQAAERTASAVLATAKDNTTRSVNANTLAGAANRQQIENIYFAYLKETPSEQIAAKMTQQVGEKMGFTAGKIYDVIGRLNGLDGMSSQFSIVGTPSLNSQQLTAVGQQLGMSFSQIEQILPGPGQAGYRAPGRARAAGGPAGGLTWVGEQGPELVRLPYGADVIPSANSMQRALLGEVRAPGHASGGPVGGLSDPSTVLAANVPIMAQWGAMDAVGQMLHVLGGPAVKLPPAGAVDLGSFIGGGGGGFGGASHVSGDRAANKAIMKAVFASYGWGTGPEWAAQDYLEMREAGYNNYAQNPHSTAFGMGQFLDSTWGAYGFRKTSDSRIQSQAMAAYEGARYGGPLGAAAHERAFNWYGGGGPAGGLIGVGEYGPELLRVPGGSSVIPHANAAIAAQSGPSELKVSWEVEPGATGAVATMLKELVRTSQLVLTVNGTRVAVG